VIEKALSAKHRPIRFPPRGALDALSGVHESWSRISACPAFGLELLQTVKQRHPAVPVIVMTAY